MKCSCNKPFLNSYYISGFSWVLEAQNCRTHISCPWERGVCGQVAWTSKCCKVTEKLWERCIVSGKLIWKRHLQMDSLGRTEHMWWVNMVGNCKQLGMRQRSSRGWEWATRPQTEVRQDREWRWRLSICQWGTVGILDGMIPHWADLPPTLQETPYPCNYLTNDFTTVQPRDNWKCLFTCPNKYR
jgi:hypothetical protein